ncbi:MAG: hypothetical protein IH630_00305 [Thermoplasmata archaeon]|nr:hypothetical protein [Thermoplasmata archaeon]TFG69824.1 MAG: hypothetical protein E4H25_03865 [Methanomassiliicoccus sp.]
MRSVLGIIYCAFVAMCLISVSVASQYGLGADPNEGWGDAELLEYNDAGGAEPPQIAAGHNGDAFAVWEQWDGFRHSVWSNRYVYDEGWGHAERLDSTDTEQTSNPHVGVDESGNAVAVWQQWDSVNFKHDVWSNRYIVGEGWGTAELIEDHSEEAGLSHVVVDASGNATAVWEQVDSGHSHIWSNRYVVGEGWGMAEEIEAYVEDAFSIDLAANDNGEVVAVWSQWEGAQYNISSNRYVVGDGWGTAEIISAEDSGYAEQANVVIDSSGNATAVWYQWGDGVYDVWSNRYVVGEGWGTAVLLEDYDSGDSTGPRVGNDGYGNALVVWMQMAGSTYHVWSNRYVVDEGWGVPELVETDELSAWIPMLAVDHSGNATALWLQSDGIRNYVSSSRYIVGEGWGIAERVSPSETESASYQRVTVDGFGNVFAVWAQYDGIRSNIWASMYLIPDITPPILTIDSPSDGFTTQTGNVLVSGVTEPGVALRVNGLSIGVESNGSFVCTVALVEGTNVITAIATDVANNSASVSISVTYIDPIHEIEEQLAAALDALATAQTELDAALDELAATQEDLDAALASLEAAQDLLDQALADLASVETLLADALGDGDILQGQLNAALLNLTAAEAELEDALDDLSALQDEFDAAQDELAGTSEDLDDAQSQNLMLMVTLAVFAVLAVLMSVMYLGIRKKMAGAKSDASDTGPPEPPEE